MFDTPLIPFEKKCSTFEVKSLFEKTSPERELDPQNFSASSITYIN
jgi:hypothetical protein